MLAEQVRVQVRQLDRVPDLLDLRSQAADLVVVDVRDFFEDEFLDLGLRDALVDVARPGLEQQRVAGPQRPAAQRLGEPDDPLLVGVRDHQRAVAVLEDLLEHDDLADRLEALGDHDVQRLVQHDFLAGPQVVELDARADADAHLAAAGENVGRAVFGRLQEDAEPARRLRQPVDLLLERDDLVAGLAQGAGQPLVLAGDRCEVRLGFAQPLLKHVRLPRRVREPLRRAATSSSRKETCVVRTLTSSSCRPE